MKKLFYILIILGLINCHSSNNQKESGKENISTSQDLMRIWGLSNYLDSIVAKKEIAKYRLQSPAWFGILLEIEEDSIKSYGSIIEVETNLISQKDTLAIFHSFGKWMLLRNQKNLILKQFPNQEILDTSIYVYIQRDDLKKMTENLDLGRLHRYYQPVNIF